MTKIEKEMYSVITDSVSEVNRYSNEWQSVLAKAAAEVAKRYIERAFKEGAQIYRDSDEHTIDDFYKIWSKENGLTE